ncbi:DUF6895 family protein [Pseudanabaena sp. Chao 1811]|uniref:DUF6895 family protein n=1 Tax=Pseudanabaena sp. Chao 1811 TaxID=2963092 RepID=UPI0022F3B5BA|nr:hypothetical protein [Pseudanabaena sp. Chao 1811]
MNDSLVFDSFLKRSLLLGLAWVSSQLQEFSINRGRQVVSSEQDITRIKPISELALTVWLLKRCGVQLPILDEIAKWMWQECDHGQYLTHLLLARNDFLPCCAFYASLYKLGYRSKRLHAVLKMLSQSDMAKVLPLQPWSHLALYYNLWQLGLSKRPTTWRASLYVEACPEPWVVSAEVAYAITHEVFYLSDFGFRPLRSQRIISYLRIWIPYWTNVFISDCNNDVAGELAMIWSCVGSGFCSSFEHPLVAVLENQCEDGSVTGPDGAGTFLYTDKDSPQRRKFLACYHTTLVIMMAAAMALRINSISKQQ